MTLRRLASLTIALLTAGMLGWSAPPAQANADLAKARNCTACHAMERKLIGPSYKDIAGRYAADKGAVDKLTKKVREGGVGAWGQIAMPANPQVSPEEAAVLVRWILSVK